MAFSPFGLWRGCLWLSALGFPVGRLSALADCWQSWLPSANHCPVSVGTVGTGVLIFIVSLSIHIGASAIHVYMNRCSYVLVLVVEPTPPLLAEANRAVPTPSCTPNNKKILTKLYILSMHPYISMSGVGYDLPIIKGIYISIKPIGKFPKNTKSRFSVKGNDFLLNGNIL